MRVSDIDVEVVLREVDLGCGCGFAMVFEFSVAFWLMNFTLELFPHLFSSRIVPLEILLPSPSFVITLNLEFPGPSLRDLPHLLPQDNISSSSSSPLLPSRPLLFPSLQFQTLSVSPSINWSPPPSQPPTPQTPFLNHPSTLLRNKFRKMSNVHP